MLALIADDKILIHLACHGARDKALPDTDIILILYDIGLCIPVVELADYGNTLSVRSPDRKIRAFDSINIDRVRAEFLIQIIMRRMSEQILVQL